MAIVAALLAFVTTTVFMFSLRPLAIAVGLVDIPGGRKRHDGPVPLIGGIAMSIGLGFGSSFVEHSVPWSIVLMAIYLLVAVGTIDDRFDLPASSRLVAQACAALLVTLGAQIVVMNLGSPLFFNLPLGVLGPPFTLIFIVTVINGFNVIDGLDGLAGGLGLLALLGLAAIGHGTPMFPVAVTMCSVVAAFLVFNLPLKLNRRFRAFMGDAGSTSLGLGIVCLGIPLCQGEAAAMSPVVGLWLIAVPVFEFFSTVTRRLVDGGSPLVPDHLHLHHTLVLNGLSRRSTLAAMLVFGLICAGVGIAGQVAEVPEGALMLLWFGTAVLYYHATRRPKAVVCVVQWVRGWRRVPPVGQLGDS